MGFTFEKGQCVNHVDGDMTSIVIDRSVTLKGNEQYHVREVELGPRRHRWIMGDALRATEEGAPECGSCRLRDVCPSSGAGGKLIKRRDGRVGHIKTCSDYAWW